MRLSVAINISLLECKLNQELDWVYNAITDKRKNADLLAREVGTCVVNVLFVKISHHEKH